MDMDPETDSWEVEEGVPQLQDPFIQKFLAGRNALIREEEQQRHDFNLRQALPPVAVKACEIVSRICHQELDRFTLDTDVQDGVPHPGTMSPQQKEAMENSDLWRIVQSMPKGSLLHGHLPAMVNLDFLISQAFATSGIYLSAPKPLLTERDYEFAPLSFQYSSLSPEGSGDRPPLWSNDYEPSSLIDLRRAASLFPEGGETGFCNWLKRRCSHMPKNHGPYAISHLLNRCLPVINSLLHHEPILRLCLRDIFSQLLADGIRYVEFRVIFDFQYRMEGSDVIEHEYLEWCRVFQEELDKFKKSEEGQGFYGARIIWTGKRGLSTKEIGHNMLQCILAKKRFPDVICGFDLVGDEAHERPLSDLLPILFWFRGRCSSEGLEVPFFFHAGQGLGDGDQADQNLFDAVLLGTRRIAHGLSLYKHPLLIDVIKSKGILVECCPTANELCGFTNSFKSHPFPALVSRGVSVALCNDSPSLFGNYTNGLTPEFWQALLAFKSMGLTGLAMMAENSIKWSCYEDQSFPAWKSDINEGILGEGLKAARLHEFYADFEGFCEWVVQEFNASDIK